jgi:hypothetical protein
VDDHRYFEAAGDLEAVEVLVEHAVVTTDEVVEDEAGSTRREVDEDGPIPHHPEETTFDTHKMLGVLGVAEVLIVRGVTVTWQLMEDSQHWNAADRVKAV